MAAVATVARVISIKTELIIAGTLLVAGLGGWVTQNVVAQPRLTVAQIGAAIGCASVDKVPSELGARETGACPLEGHHRVTIVTFDGGRQREEWLSSNRTQRPAALGAQAVVTGDGWAAVTDDLAAATRLSLKAHGWWA
jgi:hypothetical protein